jgi:hypothetical protein
VRGTTELGFGSLSQCASCFAELKCGSAVLHRSTSDNGMAARGGGCKCIGRGASSTTTSASS